MALATLQQLLERVEAEWLFDVTLPRPPSEPPTSDELATRDRKVLVALEDASADLLAYRPRMSSAFWPEADKLKSDCVRVALHHLTKNRPGKDFESIQTAYAAVIKFYEDAVTSSAASGGSSPLGISYDAPDAVMTPNGLKGLT